MKKLLNSFVSMIPFMIVALLTWGAGPVLADDDDHDGKQHHDMKLVGTNDLEARSTYQPTVHKQGGRYILYAGHHALGTNPVTGLQLPSFNPLTGKNEPNGTSIVDVTDPKHPVYLAHIPVGTPVTPPALPTNGGAQFTRVCDGATLPIHNNKVYLLRAFANSAQEIYDVTDPSHPVFLKTIISGLAGTHKNWWECDTGIAYLVGRRSTDTAAGWRPGNHILIFNLSDPANPVFIRDWALDGQQPGGVIPPYFNAVPSIHGPISTGPNGGFGSTPNRVYFAYGTGDNGVTQVVDRQKLLTSPATDFKTAEIGRWIMNPINGSHTSFPIGQFAIGEFVENDEGVVRDFVVVVSEETANECTGPRHLTYFVDVTEFAITTGTTPPPGSIVSHPQSQANFQVREDSGEFCDVGRRFGPHATNEEFGPPFYQKIVFISYFNAGVRAVDVRDPFNPKEVAFFIPKTTANTDFRCKVSGVPNTCKIAIQTNNVATDDRGFIYIVDRADTGLHILQLEGDAKKIVWGK